MRIRQRRGCALTASRPETGNGVLKARARSAVLGGLVVELKSDQQAFHRPQRPEREEISRISGSHRAACTQ